MFVCVQMCASPLTHAAAAAVKEDSEKVSQYRACCNLFTLLDNL